MEVRKGYKKTEVGVIPEDWDCIQLGNIGDCIIGLTYKPSDVKDYGRLVLRSSNINENRLVFTDNVYVDIPIKDDLVVQENDILICVRNGSRNLIGKCALIDKKSTGQTFGAFMSVFRSIYGRYLFNCFQSSIIKKQLNEIMGATINQITNKDLKSFYVPLPNNDEEQQAIAEALSDVDAVVSSLTKLINKKKSIMQGAMQELLTGKKRLDGFSGDWDEIKLGMISKINTGKKNNDDKVPDGIYPFFVRSKQIERIDTYSFDGEAIIIPGEGNIGEIFHYINGKFDYHQRVYKISNFPTNIYAKYVFYYIAAFFGEYALKNTVKATVDSLRLPTFEEFIINVPKTIQEQTAIASILSDMDAEIEALEQKLNKYKAIKQGMMHELLTGRIRLV